MKSILSILFSLILVFSLPLSVYCDEDFEEEIINDEEIVEEFLPEFDQPSEDLPLLPSEDLPEISQLPVLEHVDLDTYDIQPYASTTNGVYVLLQEFIGYVPTTTNFNEVQYLYPASVIVTVVIIMVVARTFIAIIDIFS